LRAILGTRLKQIRRCALNIGPARITIRKVRREDWAESWKKHFQPLDIGHALLIMPGWSRRRARAGQAVVVLDPGLSFGTGQHPTTAFCLEQIVARRIIGRRQSFLDIGTGSGILAVAAAKLGYRPVHAFDLDTAAVRAARANARRNRVTKRVRVFRQDLVRLPLRSEAKFDVICANLIDDLLVEQSKRLLNRLSPHGALILAGILKTQFARVQRAYAAAGLKLTAMRQEKEWQSGAFVSPR
jgi:ribosomal protein L11 methyltransferase